jgi:NADH-quinone oxidoreductase subunit C/D
VSDILETLKGRFGADVLATHRKLGDETALVAGSAVHAVLRFLRSPEGGGFDFLMDLGGVDLLEYGVKTHRYEVVYHLRSMAAGRRLRVKAAVPERDPKIDTVTDLWKCANWFEREVFDLFGVRFNGHPNLKRILTHHRFVGHALRKDYFVKDQQWLDDEPESLLDELGEFGENPEDGGFSELIPVNIGPAHPATHGTLRVLAKLDGETIVKAVQEIGYLHRAFEKHSETGTWTQVIPYTDRLNYCSAMTNNVGYCRAVEKLLGIDVPPRTKFIRIVIAEISRIIDHLVCIAASLVDLGALTNYWYCFALREKAYTALEGLCGARLTSSYVRIGGVSDDLNPEFVGQVREFLKELPNALGDVLGLVKKNRIFLDRTKGVGVITADEALSYGYTGPCLRACGVGYDLRKAEPYDGYENFDFEVPVMYGGDTHDRLLLRFDEMVQSARIIEQALDKLPGGPVFTDDRRVTQPDKPEVYSTIESLMNHFVLIYEGIKVPRGEAYSCVESPNGELGFYVVSDGSGRPYRVRVRPPCFPIYSSLPRLIEGGMLADAVATLGSLNIIAGELDR